MKTANPRGSSRETQSRTFVWGGHATVPNLRFLCWESKFGRISGFWAYLRSCSDSATACFTEDHQILQYFWNYASPEMWIKLEIHVQYDQWWLRVIFMDNYCRSFVIRLGGRFFDLRLLWRPQRFWRSSPRAMPCRWGFFGWGWHQHRTTRTTSLA